MSSSDFEKLRCRVVDAGEARTTTHQHVLLVMAQTFDTAGATILCEPSVVDGRSGTPDIAIIDPESGLHVVEVKGVTLDQVLSVQPGGALEIAYESRISRKDPSRQARNAMFDIKNAAERHFGGELNAAFEFWVVFPRIRRSEWEHKFGDAIPSRKEVLFTDELESSFLGDRMRAQGRKKLKRFRLAGPVPPGQIQSLQAAFGDSEVLRRPERPSYALPEGSLGEYLAESEAEYRVLTDQQQNLVKGEWDGGPRLVRGVAGSGKTVVMAAQIARMVERLDKQGSLFEKGKQPQQQKLLAVCFNRTLVPFIRELINMAYRQRTHDSLPEDVVMVTHFNNLMWHLADRKGLIQYQRVVPDRDPGEQARRYLADLDDAVDTELFYAVFVDEGQDFHEDEYRILLRLCQRLPSALPRMFVFYDDAQNLYGRKRPTWSDLGLEIRGRSVVLDRSYRSTKQIVEPAFNVLLGSYAQMQKNVGTRAFADLATLREKNLIAERDSHIVAKFVPRQGDAVQYIRHESMEAESTAIAARVGELLRREYLLPHDVFVLTFRRRDAERIARRIADQLGPGKVHCAYDKDNKDVPAIQNDKITVSTIASAKGYDAPFVIMASANEFEDNVRGRASFYVGCTRARNWLVVSCYDNSIIMAEFDRCLAAASQS